MSTIPTEFSRMGFARTYVAPALLIFLIPILSFFFFRHAQAKFDADAKKEILAQIQADPNLSAEEKANATELFTKVPVSRLLAKGVLGEGMSSRAKFDYATFRWMIRLSVLSIVCGLVAFMLAGICVLFSLRSQTAQYWSLLAGWHLLRIYGALQTVVIGLLAFALSFWVTVLWTQRFSPKLVLIVGLAAIIAVGLVVIAIFRKPKSELEVEGVVLSRNDESSLWQKLNAICEKVGANPPDQVIVGIDDNFFVTEHPVKVDGREVRGATLFVSLSLLQHLNEAEADAIVAHEMAHFSGQDTLYSTKISPLLQRYDGYLKALHDGGITKPIFYFMLCFRALFELSLSRLSRQREFRADEIAASTTSPRDFATGLLRVCAYSRFRMKVQNELFGAQQTLDAANISERIAEGFPAYARTCAADPVMGNTEASHPFDSHPANSQRLAALGVGADVAEIQSLLATQGDGGWRQFIPRADELEQVQWEAFETNFRAIHESTLPYRYLPETPEEQAVVERAFPPVSFEGTEGVLSLDFEKAHHATWEDAVLFNEMTKCELNDDVLSVRFERGGKQHRKIKMAKFKKDKQQVFDAFNKYYSRYVSAVEWQKRLKAQAEAAAAAAAV